MFSIALLVHAQHLTGSFAVAGIVGGAYAIASAASAPLLGGLVDRHGQTVALLTGATLSALALTAAGLLPAGAPAAVLAALAAAAGLTMPPLEACVRTLLPTMVSDPSRLPRLFAFESTVLELTFVAGPPLALGIGALWSTGAALCLSGLVMLSGTLLFAAQPASRRWRSPHVGRRVRGGALQSPMIRTLVLVELGLGVAFGATEVGVTATAHALGSPAAAGPLLGLWGLGSLLGGIVATRLGGAAQTTRGLTLLLAALALTHGALVLTTGSVVAMGAVILLAGATIAPTASSVYSMVEPAAPAGTSTEAFSWLVTAGLAGAALGAAAAGWLAQSDGASGAFAAVIVAGGFTVMVAGLRSHGLPRARRRAMLRVWGISR